MAWYNDKSRKTYVATYKNEKDMRKDVEEAVKFGWMLQDSAAIGGHINVGRTVLPAVATGGLSLLFGASRSKDKVTVTYVRDERWLARNAVDEALRGYRDVQQGMRDGIARERSERGTLEARIKASEEIDGFEREAPEKDLETALRQSIKITGSALEQCQKMPAKAATLREALQQATRVGADPPQMSFDPDAEALQVKADIDRLAGWLRQEQELLTSQQNVMKLLHEWREASKNEQQANARLEEADRRLVEARAALENASPDRTEKAGKRVREAEEERAKRAAELNHAQSETAGRSTFLETGLRRKSELASRFLQSFANDAAPQTAVPPVAFSPPASPAAATRESSTSSGDVLEQLERLAALHKAGALTDEEFTDKKADLLSRL